MEIDKIINSELYGIYERLNKFIFDYVERNYPKINKQGKEIKKDGKLSAESIRDILDDNLDSNREADIKLVSQILYNARDEYLEILARRNKEIMEKIDKGIFNTELTSEDRDYINGLNYILGKLHETPHPKEKLQRDKDQSQQDVTSQP